MKKLKVGFFVDCFYPMIDGVVHVVDQYAQRLSKFCDVTVFTVYPKKNKEKLPEFPYKVVRCKIIPLPKRQYGLAVPFFDRAFSKAVKNSELDIVHVHSPFTIGEAGVKFAKKHNIPVIATIHSQYKKDFYRATKMKWLTNILVAYIMRIFNKCDCYAVNNKVSELYYNEYKAKRMPGVLLNGTDMLPCEDAALAAKTVNEKFNLDNDVPLLLFTGRITDLKNVCFIARSLALIKEKGVAFKMIYVGDGPDENKLKALIKKLDLCDEVIMAGRITDRELIKAMYSRANLFLFPSYYDTNGLVKIEAASQHTPTVFVKGSIASAEIISEVNGFIAENNEQAYAEKIISALTDTELYNTVSKNAYEQIYVTWDECVKELYKVYEKALDVKIDG